MAAFSKPRYLATCFVKAPPSDGVFVVFGDAPNMLFVSGVILISPSNPGTPQNVCILRGAPFGLSSPVSD